MQTKTAKTYLQGHWGQAVWAEGVVLAAQWVLKLLEWGGLLLGGVSLSAEAGFPTDPAGVREWLVRGVMWIGVVLLDWLWISPLLLGRKALYWQMLSPTGSVDAGCWKRFFEGKRYWRSLQWRACLWGIRLWWSALLWGPAIGVWRMGETMQLRSLQNGTSAIPAACLLLAGIVLYLIGWVLIEVLMLRYLPTAYGLEQGMSVTAAFQYGRRVMKGHISSLLRLYRRYFWGLCSCVLVFPALYVMPLVRMEQTARMGWWVNMQKPIEKTTILW